jgi:N-acetylglucosamine-6-sulfatase
VRRMLAVALLVAVIGLPATRSSSHSQGLPFVAERPTIVLILTDDQRADTLSRMPILQSELVRKGMSFSRFYAVNPLCCPSRATILTGQYSHTTGVYFNEGESGGWNAFRRHEPRTIATTLQLAGYRTGLFGKYLNGYMLKDAAEVPMGWDRWVALVHVGYFGVPLSVDGTFVRTGPKEYSTDVLADYAVDFIRTAPRSQPLFVLYTPYAPHYPAVPSRQDAGRFANLEPHRPPSYNESDRSDKPRYVRQRPAMPSSQRREFDRFRIRMLETLPAVDRAIGRLLEALKDSGRLGNTLIMFASDNGYQLGEHGLLAKNLPYEESVRIPLVARWDGHIPPGSGDDHVVANVDLAPTWADVAGLVMAGAEGMRMTPLFSRSSIAWRQDLLIEHGKIKGTKIPAFCQIHGDRYSYVLYGTGEEELYDLETDPYQLSNLASDPAFASIRNQYRLRVSLLCLPQPPGWPIGQTLVPLGDRRL